MTLFVEATDEHFADVLRIVNAHEASVDADAPTMGETGIRDLMAGYIDASVGHVQIDEGSGKVVGFVQAHPDSNRDVYFPDVYVDPAVSNLASTTAQAIEFMLEQTARQNPTWSLRAGMNVRDELMTQIYSQRGFSFLRKYWSLSRPLASSETASALPDNVELRAIQDTQADLALLHELHQDAFSSHFGFKAREQGDWIRLELERETREPAGNVFILESGIPVGFLLSANEMEHENGGYVDLLGVVHKAQGKGYGKILLEWAIEYNSKLGRTKVDLNVDTGNTSAALHVYEKVGFKPISAWHQYELIRS